MKKAIASYRLITVPALALAVALVASESAFAHCDTVDGPVVASARRALAEGDVTPVLKWVGPQHEDGIRSVFEQALAVRGLGEPAQQLADRHFFETLVRLHREGEGFGFTGLKPVGEPVSPVIQAADAALESGSADDLVTEITEALAAGVRTRFEHARELRAHAEESVARGREFVAAYVEFTHYVEGLDAVAAGHQVGHGTAATASATDAHVGADGAHGGPSSTAVVTLSQQAGDGPGQEVSVILDESHLKLAVLTLRQGTVLPSHSAPVPTTIQVLQGEGVIHIDTKPVPVSAGDLVSLGAGAAHEVVPVRGSDMLLLVHYLRGGGSMASHSSSEH